MLKALLITGGAMAFMSCSIFGDGAAKSTADEVAQSKERFMTEKSDNLTVVMSENGEPSYIFEAPLVEGYAMASEPYREFRKGIKITTFDDGDMSGAGNVMSANYAIYYEERRLWEVIGDVEIVKQDGKELYSQQLFWNAQTRRIYSNVDTEIRNRETGDIYRGEGFESDEEMVDWTFRKMTGRMKMAEQKSTEEREAEQRAREEQERSKQEAQENLRKQQQSTESQMGTVLGSGSTEKKRVE